MRHEHRWIVFSTDVCARTATLYCLCGAVDEAQVVDEGALATLLDTAANRAAEVTP